MSTTGSTLSAICLPPLATMGPTVSIGLCGRSAHPLVSQALTAYNLQVRLPQLFGSMSSSFSSPRLSATQYK